MSTEPYDPPETLNIADLFLDARVRDGDGDRVALRIDRGPEMPAREMTYRDVQALADRFARVLAAQGVEPEQRVVLSLPDGAEFVGALFGTLKLGAVAVLANPQFGPDELRNLFDYVRPKLVVAGGPSCPACAAACAGRDWPHGLLIAGSDPGHETDGWPRFEDEAARLTDDGPFPTLATHRDDPAIWLFSGGTTGRPKAVVQSHRSFANTTELYALRALGYQRDDLTLSVPKLYFGYATGSNLFFPFAVGATAVLFADKPTPDALFDLIRRHRPTILINVPTLINQMVSHPAADAQDLSCLRFSTSAGEALPVSLHDRFKELFGVELLDGLGTAEMWHIFLTNLPGEIKPGTLGRVVPGFELRVRDDEGRDVADGEVGRLWVRGGSRALGYWREMDKTETAFQGPWFVGGDLVSRDADGYVTYHGRGDDVLKVAGRWLVPSEVEDCLMRHRAVKECAVVGVTDAAGLTKPHAFVVSRPSDAPADGGEDSLAETLKEHVLGHLEPYKHPREIHFLDVLPRTHLGKIDRGKLKTLG